MSKPPGPGPLQSALALAARGWHVFPCAPGTKRPGLRGSWQDHATTDPGQIRAWWARAPWNIAVACGPSGLAVIDLDTPRPGQHPGQPSGTGALAALCARHGHPFPLPAYTVATPSGGRHLYYAAPGATVRNSAGKLGPHIDVRADGGYVIAAGSHAGGRPYTVLDDRPPPPLPGWITALLTRAGHEPAAGKHLPAGGQGTSYAMAALREETRLVADAVPGTRNDTLNRAAFSLGQLTAAGLLPQLSVITALASAASHAGLPAGEARRTINSGLSAGLAHPRTASR